MVDGAAVWMIGVGAALAAFATFGLCLLAVRASFGLDQVSARSNHAAPTPRTGGLMLLVGSALGITVVGFAGWIGPELLTLIGLALMAGLLGLADDFLDLPAPARLAVQIGLAAAGAFWLGPESEAAVPFMGWVGLPLPAALALSTLWIVGMMNVINFMDGLNGLIGSVAIVLLGLVATFATDSIPVIVVIQTAVLAFLAVNVFWGRIFLGDAGSLSLGFFIAGVGLLPGADGGQFWLMPLVAVPLIADVAFTLVRRFLRGEDLMESHREHVYQRLKQAGWSHQASSLSVLVSVLLAMGLSMLLAVPNENPAIVYWAAVFAAIGCWALVSATMMSVKVESRIGLERSLR